MDRGVQQLPDIRGGHSYTLKPAVKGLDLERILEPGRIAADYSFSASRLACQGIGVQRWQ
jgi:hypothetical protein